MRYIVGAILLSLAFLASPVKAQDALVVQTCGTLPLAYSPGATRLVTVDTTGKLCSSAGGGGLVAGAAVTGCPVQANLFVTSTLTLGCVAALSESDTGSTLTTTGNILLPDTNAGGTAGVIQFGGARFIHDFNATSNVFIGHNAYAAFAGTPTTSVCVGESCMLSATGGAGNTCVGRFCMGGALSGSSNTGIGNGVMSVLTSGGSNVGVGAGANQATTTSNTTCVGASSCAAVTGSNSTGLGFAAGGSMTGASNTILGASAGSNLGAGGNNTFVGSTAGGGVTTGTGSTIIGQGCGGLAAGLTSGIVLGNAACAAKLDFGVTTASIWTFLGGTIAAPLTTDATHTDASVCRDTTSGQFFFGSGAAGICLGTSGRQFKTDIVPMVAGIDELMKMDFVNYRFLPGYGDNGARKQYGLIAQDVEAVLPDLAGHNVTGETINYDIGAVWMMYGHAIQQLKADFEAYKRDHP